MVCREKILIFIHFIIIKSVNASNKIQLFKGGGKNISALQAFLAKRNASTKLV